MLIARMPAPAAIDPIPACAKPRWGRQTLPIVLVLGVTLLRGLVGTAGLSRESFAPAGEFDFGFEQGHIAGNIARGLGYSVRFGDSPPIPTAWASPLYPIVLAGVFRLFGAFTYDSAIAVIWLNAMCHGGISALLLLTGRRILRRGSDRLGMIAIALFVGLPMGWQFLHWAWCVHLLALLLLWHIYLISDGRNTPVSRAAWAGISLGLALLTDGAAITVVPVTIAALCMSTGLARHAPGPTAGCKGNRLTALAICAAAALVTLSPWMIRNGLVLDSWTPLRGMLGTALWMGNHPDAAAEDYHGLAQNPWHHVENGRRFVALGERGFDADCNRRFVNQLRADPALFVKSTCMRASGFWLNEWWRGWTGYPLHYSVGVAATSLLAAAGAVLGLRRGLCIGPVLKVCLLFPIPYYITFLSYGRYRLPMEPLLYLLAAIVFMPAGLAPKLGHVPQRSSAGGDERRR